MKKWLVLIVTVMLTFGVTQTAAADSATISGTAGIGTFTYSKQRTNYYTGNSVYVKNSTAAGYGGGCAKFYLRSTATGRDFASTDCFNDSGTHYFRTLSTNSTSIPAGTFTITLYVMGACGGNGCGTWSWSANLYWNIQASGGGCSAPTGTTSLVAREQIIIC